MGDFLDMMKEESKKEIDKERFYSQHGICKDVDKVKRTCTFLPAGDDAERFDIRFQSLMGSDKGWVVIPVEGSAITVTFVNKSTGFVSLTEDIEQIIYQGGNNGGLINIEVLKAELAKNNAILQAILSILGGAPIPEAGNGAPSSLQAALGAVTSVLQLGDFNNMEDTSLLH